MKILTGNDAEHILTEILDGFNIDTHKFPEPYVTGFYKDGNVYIAFDNLTKNCWVEEFKTARAARRWCLASND